MDNNHEDILLSVIIPTYNAEQYIERCVQSLLSNTNSNVELVLVNDGSVDSGGEICDRLKQSDTRIKVIHKKNGGVSSARNCGLDVALGKYITFIDADDFVSDAFKDACLLLKDDDLYCFPYCEIRGNEKRIKMPNSSWNGRVITNLNNGKITTGIFNSVCMKIFKTEIITINKIRFDSSLKIAEDFKFVIDYLSCCKDIKFIGKCYYNYFRNEGSAMHEICFDKIVNTLDACKYAIEKLHMISNKQINKFCAKLISENLLSVFARIGKYNKDQNDYLIKNLRVLRKYFIYGSSFIKKIIIILIRITGIKNASRIMKIIKK